MPRSWFKITALAPLGAQTQPSYEICLYGVIGESKYPTFDYFTGEWCEGGAGTLKEFVDAFSVVPPDAPLRVRIASEGGELPVGLAIYAKLNDHKGPVTCTIEGFAWSAASVIAMAGDVVEAHATDTFMLHNAECECEGNQHDMETMKALLVTHDNAQAAAYAAKCGKKPEAMLALMEAVTFLDGAGAKQMGFVDVILSSAEATTITARLDPSRIRAASPRLRAAFDTLKVSTSPESSKPAPAPNMLKAITALAAIVGLDLKGDETEDQIVTACKAHKPAQPKMELNLEDPETKKIFDAAVASGITAQLPGAVKEATKDITAKFENLEALVKNGPASASQGAPPVGGGGSGGDGKKKEIPRAAFDALESSAREEFFRDGGKIIG